jgi:hypothetical protein
MKDLIKQILIEYVEPVILIYEIVVSNLVNEQDFMRQLHKSDDSLINLYKNSHSMDSVGTSSSFQRVDPDEINDSIIELQSTIIRASKKIMETCNSRCSINVIDDVAGIDYHMWLNLTKNNTIKVIINTSIGHPNHLFFNKKISPTILVDRQGNISTKNIYN